MVCLDMGVGLLMQCHLLVVNNNFVMRSLPLGLQMQRSKEYYCVDAAETTQIRTKEKGNFILKPCRQFHVIGVNQKGDLSKVLYFRDQDIVSTLFDKTVSNIDQEHDNDDNQTEPAFSLNHDTIFELVDPGIFVGIQSPRNAIEPFFIVEVFNKGVVQEVMSDANGHYILSEEQYAEVGYLQKKR